MFSLQNLRAELMLHFFVTQPCNQTDCLCWICPAVEMTVTVPTKVAVSSPLLPLHSRADHPVLTHEPAAR